MYLCLYVNISVPQSVLYAAININGGKVLSPMISDSGFQFDSKLADLIGSLTANKGNREGFATALLGSSFVRVSGIISPLN